MTDITRYQSGPKLSRAVVHNGIIYLCGQVAKDYEADLKEQTRTMLERVDEHLAEAGTDRNRMLSATIYIKDITQVAQMNEVWGEWLGDGPRPARTCVQAEMAKPNILVEITVTAAL
ncbi:MAG: RidA family protein [Rickettsiales bacterium]|nr:RidA family protein [Rickettsiales bacterium]